ncbi:1,4-alpha-glucan branching enzyme [Breznakia sp. PF5-3]|uniref:1,4-alpha-glucan branching protein GlgB n=1 Tax=unclassified Breznakia TaxID=2623764 RepID=UPI002405ADEE|nr:MULTISPECIES: 1,4-alpha-glucan branching protein GlgB [unclassified Breznakia]MDF9824799.1 1,4-alpha-glucan branching enzyme [Breznakia sp. PM6-1]MDF9835745.1 1,4-alpha-glucan branching enzyme [Breznakia sp. PF5-3]MDF9837831.1 1,4-alpha-glucan branching enzyme [Breznakia sp. PFB2-8]MDF9859798.1 1,4-alpha-glucan branching enzyme [Breznakia sp. PH5-24]
MKSRVINAFFEGQSIDSYTSFGAHIGFEQTSGVRFSVYAPAAKSVRVIGSFNDWNPDSHVMQKVDNRGVWSIFIVGAKAGDYYKYRVEQADGEVVDKMDPYAFYSELRPNTASIVVDLKYEWSDQEWMDKRTRCFHSPMNIYEMHLGAWKTNGEEVTYRSICEALIAYIKEMKFTHVEFMPLSEYPFDGSWGYQTSGYFSATSRYGSIQDLKYLINELHRNNIGVIFDFVPVHFVMDNYALRNFDGTHLYEYEKKYDAFSEWGTANFDLHKEEVRSFLMSAAGYWLSEFHGDGLRIDAVSNIIYWQGNKDRGINEGALTFIRRMNYLLHKHLGEVILIAEDSSDFENVTSNINNLGLGFDYKWDLGWMNDTLEYFKMDPVYRQHNHNKINFSMSYFFSENFILPFSHDEVVHGKATIVNKMWGSYEEKFAQARLLYTYMYTHPGKKLNFMGNEIGHMREFDEEQENDWFLLEYPMHDSFKRFMKDLNTLYTTQPALYQNDYDYRYFEWIDADNTNENLFSFIRKSDDETLVVILNMSPNTYKNHYFGVLEDGLYEEILNSEKDIYSGSNIINSKPVKALEKYVDYKPYYIKIDVAPFAGVILKHVNKHDKNKYFE